MNVIKVTKEIYCWPTERNTVSLETFNKIGNLFDLIFFKLIIII